MTYAELYGSVAALVRRSGVLRSAAASGALLFGAFTAFWTTLVFFLATPPYHYGARAAGLFGLVAAASAAAAPVVGRVADHYSPRAGVLFGGVLALAGFVVLWAAGTHLGGLVAGVVLLDLGVNAGHVANQARIYGAFPDARSRANTAYMVTYFIGGALGSTLAAHAWSAVGWSGVCAVGCGFAALACVASALLRD